MQVAARGRREGISLPYLVGRVSRPRRCERRASDIRAGLTPSATSEITEKETDHEECAIR
jgi:hypothetical protein